MFPIPPLTPPMYMPSGLNLVLNGQFTQLPTLTVPTPTPFPLPRQTAFFCHLVCVDPQKHYPTPYSPTPLWWNVNPHCACQPPIAPYPLPAQFVITCIVGIWTRTGQEGFCLVAFHYLRSLITCFVNNVDVVIGLLAGYVLIT